MIMRIGISSLLNILIILLVQTLSVSILDAEAAASSSPPPLSPYSCISYTPSKRLITVACNSANLTDIFNQLNDDSILKKESSAGNDRNDTIWLLNAKLLISKNSKFTIDSADTAWLKIGSDGISAYSIIVYGSMKIDSVKITSWNPKINTYATNIGPEPRAFIRVMKEATGTTDITNSEIAYLGYSPNIPPRAGVNSGLNYDGGHGSILRANNIHHLWAGIYSRGVDHVIIENNNVHHNYHYGLDPHTGTHDIVIRNNTVHDNGEEGIICSLDCYNLRIENNEVYNNTQAGIMFSRNMTNSVARNNYVHEEDKGIFVSQSDNNEIYNNTVLNSRNGIYLKSSSSDNKVYNNTIVNSTSNGILVNVDSSRNTFYSNTIRIINPVTNGINVLDPANSVGNKFENNQIVRFK